MYKEQRCIAILQIHKKKLEDTGLLLASAKDEYRIRTRDLHAYTLFVHQQVASCHKRLSSSNGFKDSITNHGVSISVLRPCSVSLYTMNNLLLCQQTK